MGVDYYYCGDCRESMHSDCFPQCHFCSETFESSSGHGIICDECIDGAVKDKDVFKSKRCKDSYFCSKDCRKEWIKEFKENEKDIRKCNVCNKEGDMNTLFEAQELVRPRMVYCSNECQYKDIRKCIFCNKEQKRINMHCSNFELYCNWKCCEDYDRLSKTIS